MSFPLDYRFYGKSIGIKYRLVGNAVPPKLAFAFAKAIVIAENRVLQPTYHQILHGKNEHFFDLNNRVLPMPKEKPRHPKSRYKYHIPYLIVDSYRVELTNHHSDFRKLNFKWDVEIHRSQGPRAERHNPNISRDVFTQNELEKMDEFYSSIEKSLVGFNEFQAIHCLTTRERKKQKLLGPFELLDKVRNFVDTLSRTSDMSVYVKNSKAPLSLPRKISIGYFILCRVIDEMEGLSL